jgi:hypothetical protein
VQFDIDFSVTGANLQRSVELIYSLIVNGQPTPVQSVSLVIGELLQSSMPMPKLEGFDGEVLDVGLIKDDTKVLCGVWPFQCAGCPIWLEYVETFAGGGKRVKQQFVGAAHDQEVGLSYLAEVEWLRGCKADSRLAVVLKVGLYEEAVESETVACRVRSYGVKAGLDDLTTFENYDWNHWAISSNREAVKISLSGNEYFVESVPHHQNPTHHSTFMSKCYQKIDTGAALQFSFDYRTRDPKIVIFTHNGQKMLGEELAASVSWRSITVRFNVAEPLTPNILLLSLSLYGYGQVIHLKNLRLKKT